MKACYLKRRKRGRYTEREKWSCQRNRLEGTHASVVKSRTYGPSQTMSSYARPRAMASPLCQARAADCDVRIFLLLVFFILDKDHTPPCCWGGDCDGNTVFATAGPDLITFLLDSIHGERRHNNPAGVAEAKGLVGDCPETPLRLPVQDDTAKQLYCRILLLMFVLHRVCAEKPSSLQNKSRPEPKTRLPAQEDYLEHVVTVPTPNVRVTATFLAERVRDTASFSV